MPTIANAEDATFEIAEKVQEAINALNYCQGRVVNGFGVYSDPSSRKADLLRAKQAIETALTIAHETRWPSHADYEGAEE